MSKPKGYSSSMSCDNRVISFLIFNFPETWSRVDCRSVFENYGTLKEVYFARKRLSSGQRFGYVRFENIDDIDSFTKVLNTIHVNGKWIRTYKALERNRVNRPSSEDRANFLNVEDFPSAPWNHGKDKPLNREGKSYADLLGGVKQDPNSSHLPTSNHIEVRVGGKCFDFNLPESLINHSLVFSFNKDRISWSLIDVNKIRVADDGGVESKSSKIRVADDGGAVLKTNNLNPTPGAAIDTSVGIMFYPGMGMKTIYLVGV